MAVVFFIVAANACDCPRNKSAEANSVDANEDADNSLTLKLDLLNHSAKRGNVNKAIIRSVINASLMLCTTKIPPVSTAAKQPSLKMSPAAMRVKLAFSALRCSVLDPI